ncbi:hypothetical protein A9267_15995 [Shewanella sp. UCD-FRSSP16_17]|uniref:DUF4437 domain-containing protein n=1 Tax=Shewanella sp. UCD-FRSSP16_17 TaxID=1853256 RepID=UPI0007EEC900|nr:DUF4437 domain-containing protein [Shewanella sp. UCD-FRSSP16_17]OBT05355.1 hypothetical protein A9267_15995 [Shewanella sp. UCD-FRSSP16_17]
MNLLHTLLPAILLSTLPATAVFAETSPQSEVITTADIDWGYLNPLRGDKSPGAANLWGDRTQNVPTGMLVKFNKGFSSPPHIHNITYRGVVIEGKMHNDDPDAATMWMPTGSFWTQPAGENHITAANGEDNLIFLEIDSGPYLVKPSNEQFDNGERPINLHQSNLVWLDQTDMKSINGNNAEITALWGSNKVGELGGAMIKLPANFSGTLTSDAEEFRAIVIKGSLSYQSVETPNRKGLTAGSYFGSNGKFSHNVTTSAQGAMVYIRTDGKYHVAEK